MKKKREMVISLHHSPIYCWDQHVKDVEVKIRGKSMVSENIRAICEFFRATRNRKHNLSYKHISVPSVSMELILLASAILSNWLSEQWYIKRWVKTIFFKSILCCGYECVNIEDFSFFLSEFHKLLVFVYYCETTPQTQEFTILFAQTGCIDPGFSC